MNTNLYVQEEEQKRGQNTNFKNLILRQLRAQLVSTSHTHIWYILLISNVTDPGGKWIMVRHICTKKLI